MNPALGRKSFLKEEEFPVDCHDFFEIFTVFSSFAENSSFINNTAQQYKVQVVKGFLDGVITKNLPLGGIFQVRLTSAVISRQRSCSMHFQIQQNP